MARIVVSSYMIRFPLGGMMSWTLQYLSGLARLGHEVWLLEQAHGERECFDPRTRTESDEASYGMAVVNELLGRVGLEHRWCFIDRFGEWHGIDKPRMIEVLKAADLLIDLGSHIVLTEAEGVDTRAFIDGEPGFTQILMVEQEEAAKETPGYDYYYTTGLSVGTDLSTSPTAGRDWGHIVTPIDTALYAPSPVPPGSPFTTVMNWQSHSLIEYEGVTYGQKDIEFEEYIDLPSLVDASLEVAVSGKNIPRQRLEDHGWQQRDAFDVAASYDTYHDYVLASAGEFSVAKNVFVALRTGLFPDRSGLYLARGRPVVMQDTGFSNHLPTGEGLFAPTTVGEAAAAIDAICSDPDRHSRVARDIASDLLDSRLVLSRFLEELGIA